MNLQELNSKIQDLTKKAFSSSLEVNNKTKHNVFFDFSGHVDKVNVTIHYNSWKSDDEKMELYFQYRNEVLNNGSKPLSFSDWKRKSDLLKISRFEWYSNSWSEGEFEDPENISYDLAYKYYFGDIVECIKELESLLIEESD